MTNRRIDYRKLFLYGCLGLVWALSGCAEPPDRVFYHGWAVAPARQAMIVTNKPEELRVMGYEQIGTITSEPMTQSARLDELPQDPQAQLNTLAPEKSPELTQYYAMIDQQACKRAAKAGGDVLRLEEVRHTFPEFRLESAVLMGKDVRKDIKSVNSVKVWSVWRKARK